MKPRTKRLLLATAALSAAAAGCSKKNKPPLGNPKGSHYDLGLDAAPADADTTTPDAAPAPPPSPSPSEG